jgi:DNA topoisomerase-3
MPCTTCLHPTCQHSPAQQAMAACPNCATAGLSGALVLDPVSAPKWRIDCSRCNFLIYLPKELHSAKVSKEPCEVGGRRLCCCFAAGPGCWAGLG